MYPENYFWLLVSLIFLSFLTVIIINVLKDIHKSTSKIKMIFGFILFIFSFFVFLLGLSDVGTRLATVIHDNYQDINANETMIVSLKGTLDRNSKSFSIHSDSQAYDILVFNKENVSEYEIKDNSLKLFFNNGNTYSLIFTSRPELENFLKENKILFKRERRKI